MLKLTLRRRALAATAPMLVGLAALAGCGADSTPSDEGVAPASGAQAAQRQFVDVIHRVLPQVVQIETSEGLGWGIVYDNRGDIVTNAHVAGDSHRFVVTTADGDRGQAVLAGTDPSNDLAVIRVSGATPKPATFRRRVQRAVGRYRVRDRQPPRPSIEPHPGHRLLAQPQRQ